MRRLESVDPALGVRRADARGTRLGWPDLRANEHALRKLARNWAALTAAALLAGLLLAAVFARQLAPYDPLRMALGEVLQPPSARHWFGTDQFGRDIFSRVVYGTRFSLPLGGLAVALGASLGTGLGLVAGYFEGWPRRLIMRTVDLMLGFPVFLLALFAVAAAGPGLVSALLAVGLASSPMYARVVYSSVLTLRERDYVVAARALAAPEAGILLWHILPNAAGPLIVVATTGLGYALLSSAALSFLGLGAAPPTPEWGAMVYEGRAYLRDYWWLSTLPGLMIAATVLTVNVLGDGLRDALDPHAVR